MGDDLLFQNIDEELEENNFLSYKSFCCKFNIDFNTCQKYFRTYLKNKPVKATYYRGSYVDNDKIHIKYDLTTIQDNNASSDLLSFVYALHTGAVNNLDLVLSDLSYDSTTVKNITSIEWIPSINKTIQVLKANDNNLDANDNSRKISRTEPNLKQKSTQKSKGMNLFFSSISKENKDSFQAKIPPNKIVSPKKQNNSSYEETMDKPKVETEISKVIKQSSEDESNDKPDSHRRYKATKRKVICSKPSPKKVEPSTKDIQALLNSDEESSPMKKIKSQGKTKKTASDSKGSKISKTSKVSNPVISDEEEEIPTDSKMKLSQLNKMQIKNKKRYRHVTRTTTDKDGFLVSESVLESCSASETEGEKTSNTNEVVKDPLPINFKIQNQKGKNVSKTNTGKMKQASLTSFFGKS